MKKWEICALFAAIYMTPHLPSLVGGGLGVFMVVVMFFYLWKEG